MKTVQSELGRGLRMLTGAAVMGAAVWGAALAVHAAETEKDAQKKAAAEKEEGAFVRLLEGDAAKLWKGYGREGWPEGWAIADGVLHRSGSGGDLQTVAEFGDFDLRFAWKVAPGGNSGVMYRVSQEKGPAYLTGPEYQVLDDAAHQDGKNALTSAGSLYALYPPAKKVVKPAGQWNKSRIVVRNNRIQHYLNGAKVVDVELGGDEWKEKVAASKFAAWEKFGKNERGHIVLQDHGDEVWYRNVRIKAF